MLGVRRGFISILFGLIVQTPPAEAASPPFGIYPKVEHLEVSRGDDSQHWPIPFHGVEDFVARIRQPAFTLLASGETPLVYYALFRTSPNVAVFAYAFKQEEKRNGSFGLCGSDGTQSDLVKNSERGLTLLKVEAVAKSATLGGAAPVETTQGFTISGYCAQVRPGYSGKMTLNFQLWNQGKDNLRPGGSVTIDWKK